MDYENSDDDTIIQIYRVFMELVNLKQVEVLYSTPLSILELSLFQPPNARSAFKSCLISIKW